MWSMSRYPVCLFPFTLLDRCGSTSSLETPSFPPFCDVHPLLGVALPITLSEFLRDSSHCMLFADLLVLRSIRY